MFHAKGGDGNTSRPLSQDEVNADDTILTTTFKDVAGLDEDIKIAQVFDEKFSYRPGFVNGGAFALHGLLQGAIASRRNAILSMQEEEGEIFERVGTRDARKSGFVHTPTIRTDRDIGGLWWD